MGTHKPGDIVLAPADKPHAVNGRPAKWHATITCGYPGCKRQEGAAALSMRDARHAFEIVGWQLDTERGYVCQLHR